MRPCLFKRLPTCVMHIYHSQALADRGQGEVKGRGKQTWVLSRSKNGRLPGLLGLSLDKGCAFLSLYPALLMYRNENLIVRAFLRLRNVAQQCGTRRGREVTLYPYEFYMTSAYPCACFTPMNQP